MNQLLALVIAIPIRPVFFILMSLLTSTVIVLLLRWISSGNDGNTLKQIRRQRIEYIRIHKKKKQQLARLL